MYGYDCGFAHGFLQRLLLLIGLVMAYAIYAIATNILGLGEPINFALITDADWFGLPNFSSPTFDTNALPIIAPVAFILVAENLGHIKAVGAMTGRKFNTVSWQSICGRWRSNSIISKCGRHRYDHLWRKYWCDGGNSCLFNTHFCTGRHICHDFGIFSPNLVQ